MSSIDQRIVQMQFDNAKFEQGAKTSMSTLEKLKSALNFDKSVQSLSKLQNAGNKINFSGLASGVETISARFTNLGIVGVAALTNITNAAINAGTQMVKSLTLDPVLSGFNEYETKMNSITTILTNTASKGTTLDDVNKALNELNTYADQTIYNFAEMTRNIGTFTAAGVDLDSSVKAIKGIANLAAGSGSTSAQASTAMYQLSQALAAGRVSLQDWNSVVNAGMGGELFQNALKETAKQMGIVVDESVSFRESLSTAGGKESWLTSDVLIKTLEKFANDESLVKAATQVKTFTQLIDTLGESVQSGWAQTWETIIGDSEQAAELFTKLSDNIGGAFNKISNSRNAVLSGVLTSNWDKLVTKINEANISTDTFETKVKEVAASHGIDVNKMISDYGSLEKAFQSGAMSTDILKEAVSNLGTSMLDVDGIFKRGDGLSSASDDVKKIQEALQAAGYELTQFGADGKYGKETEEAIKMFQQARGITADGIVGPETIAKLQEATKSTTDLSGSVSGLIDDVNKLSGRDLLIDALGTAFTNFGKILEAIGNGWERVFPPKSIDERADKLYDLIQSFHDFAESLAPSEKTLDNISRTFSGVFSLFDIGAKAASAFARGFLDVIGYVLPVGDGILSVTANIGDFITGIDQLITKYGIFDSAVNAVTGVIKGFIDIIKGGVSEIKNFGEVISAHTSIPWLEDPIASIEKLIQKFIELKDNAKDSFDSLRSGAGTISDYVSTVFDKITTFTVKVIDSMKKLAQEVRSVTGPIGENIREAFDGVTITDAIGTGLLAGIVLVIKRVFNAIEDAFDDVNSLTDKISDTLDSVRSALEAYQNQLNAGTLLRIAGAVALLAAALFVLTKVDSDKLATGLAGVSVLLAEVLAAMAVISKFNITGIAGAATSMIIMSIAVGMLASAMTKFKEFQDWDSTWPALVSMVGLMTGLTASAKILSKNVNGMELIKASAGLLIFSAAVGQLAKSMQTFSQLDTGQIIKSLTAIGVLLAEIGAFIQLSKIDKLKGGKQTIIEIAAAMLVLYYAVEKLGNLDFNTLVQGMSAVSILMLELSVAIMAMNHVNMKGVSTSVIAIAVALNLLIIPIELLGRMKLSSLAKGLVAVGVALGAMTLSLGALSGNSGGLIAASSAMILMATAMTLLVVPIAALGSLPISTLAVGIGALAIVLVGLGAAGVALAPLGPALLTVAGAFTLFGIAAASIGAGLVLVSTGLATLAVSGVAGATALAGALTIIVNTLVSLIPQIAAGVVTGIATFVSTLASQAVVIEEALETLILTAAKALTNTAPALAESFVIMLDAMLAIVEEYGPELADKLFNILIGFLEVFEQRMPELVAVGSRLIGKFLDEVFKAFDNYQPENLITMIGAISALVAVFALLSKMSGMIKGAIKTTAAMMVVMGMITAIFAILGQFDASESVQNAEALSMLLTSLSASMFIISKVPIHGALTGIAGLGIVIAGLTAILTALGGLSQIPGLTWLIDEGTAFLSQIGEAIGSFVGSIIGGFAAGVTNSFPQIGQNLSDFMNNARPFFDGISSIDSSALTGVGTLASAILVLTAANVIDGLTSWLTGGNALVQFGQELAEFAPYFNTYYESIKGVDGTVVEASANAALALAEFANKVPNSGGLASIFAGENSLVTFAEQLTKFGPALKKYADSVSGLDPNVVTNTANAAKTLAEFAANIPNTGGLVSLFTGDNSLSVFADQLSNFGPKLKSYATSISGLDPNVVINSVNAAKALSELASNLPNTGGLVSFFTGDNGLGAFGNQLVKFGNSMASYYTTISGIDFTLVATSTSAFKKLADLASSIAGQDFSGLASFSENLAKIGSNGVNSFINAFKDATPQGTAAGTALADAIVNSIRNTINSSAGSITASGQNIARQLVSSMTSAINSGSASVRASAVAVVQNMTSGMMSQLSASAALLQNSARTMTTQMVNTIITVITTNIPKAQNAMRQLATGIINTAQQIFTSSYPRFRQFGETMMSNLEEGANSNKSGIRDTFDSAMSSAENAVSGYYDEFYSAGSYAMDGLADGIWANRSAAINAAASVAASAYAAACRELDINSPSKKFEWIGRMSDEGLGGGFLKYAGVIQRGASRAADVAYSGMESALTKITSILNDNIDASPVIRPVMDLSDVSNGVSLIDSLMANQNGTYFGGIYSGNIGRNLQAVGAMSETKMITAQTNNRDVVEAVNTLGERMDLIAEEIRNMQVVLDTGATVGGISNKMDQDFGKKEVYRRRNI